MATISMSCNEKHVHPANLSPIQYAVESTEYADQRLLFLVSGYLRTKIKSGSSAYHIASMVLSELDEEDLSDTWIPCQFCQSSGRLKLSECFACKGKKTCYICHGEGKLVSRLLTCRDCSGSGISTIPEQRCTSCTRGNCGQCGGDGTYAFSCSTCNGTGIYEGYGMRWSYSADCRNCVAGRKLVECNRCDGTGACFRCDGNGVSRQEYYMQCRKCVGAGKYMHTPKCRKCVATGICMKCNGSGDFQIECKLCNGEGAWRFMDVVRKTKLMINRHP